MVGFTLTAEEKITKAKMKLIKEKPFFSHLLLYLKVEKKDEVGTAGVDSRGEMAYNEKWVNQLNEEQIKTLLCHEILHTALQHLKRLGNRDVNLYNIAGDIVINNILVENGFGNSFPPTDLKPDNNEIEIGGITIDKISEKSAEEIYDILYKKARKVSALRFDIHTYDKGEGDNKTDWERKLLEASIYAEMQGSKPSGMDRILDKLKKPKINWKQVLQKCIQKELPCDWAYDFPSKKSHAIGIYMPRIKRENAEIIVAVDTSGSIGQKELTAFCSEIVGIGRSHENLKMTLLVCDAQIQNEYEVKNGNLDKIKNLKMKGGGGTDFTPVFDWIQKKKPNSRLLVYLTDGYGDFPTKNQRNTLWVVVGEKPDKEFPFGRVMRLKED